MEDYKMINTKETEEKARKEQPALVESGVSDRAPLENQQMIAQILLADDQVVRLIDTGGANPFKINGDLVWS
jgi:hypothetical protein